MRPPNVRGGGGSDAHPDTPPHSTTTISPHQGTDPRQGTEHRGVIAPAVPLLHPLAVAPPSAGRRLWTAFVGCPWCSEDGVTSVHVVRLAEPGEVERDARCGRGRYRVQVAELAPSPPPVPCPRQCPDPGLCPGGPDELAEHRSWRRTRDHLHAHGLPANRPSREGWCG